MNEETFGIIPTKISTTLVNFYSDSNSFIENDEECYFLLTSLYDYHLPVVCKGKVIFYEYAEGMTRKYYIEFIDIIDDKKTAELSLFDKPFYIYNFKDNIISTKALRLKVLTQNMFNNNYFNVNPSFKRLFQINSFFCRGYKNISEDQALADILAFRKEYVEYIITDLNKNIEDAKRII